MCSGKVMAWSWGTKRALCPLLLMQSLWLVLYPQEDPLAGLSWFHYRPLHLPGEKPGR